MASGTSTINVQRMNPYDSLHTVSQPAILQGLLLKYTKF